MKLRTLYLSAVAAVVTSLPQFALAGISDLSGSSCSTGGTSKCHPVPEIDALSGLAAVAVVGAAVALIRERSK